ncbi:MAG: four helix bundle protein [Bacteroidota bacterium]
MIKSYRDLDIYQIALHLFFQTHALALKLPKHELFALGSQLRRSSDSINSNIVEGYGRRRYKRDYLKFLTYAHASNDETRNHLVKIAKIYPAHLTEAKALAAEYDKLGIKIHYYIKYVEEHWRATPG